MSQIKQMIILRQQGNGIKTMARMLDMSKNTVKSYLFKPDKLLENNRKTGLTTKKLLSMEGPEIDKLFLSGDPSYKDPRYEHFISNLPYYQKELKRKGVTKTLLWEEYRESYPGGYGRSQFCHHLSQQEVARAKPSMVLAHKPAEKLYIDFAGKPICYIDRETGEEIKCQLFVACLPCSDYAFAMAVPSQTIPDFLHALSRCIEQLGGVPQLLVPDNFKAAVIRADKYEPSINRALEDFANHYGTAVVPARARKPQDKALVENQVKVLYSRVYAKLRNAQFFDIHSLNQAIAQKVKAHNQTRMQQKPYCREERFLADEKDLLGKLPVERFELRHYAELTVAKNNHVYLSRDKHYYSVPYALIGQKVKVVYTRSMLYVFHKGERVATHSRGFHQGPYSTLKEHLCSQHQHYRDRSPAYYRGKAAQYSSTFAKYIAQVFKQDRCPEQLYKTCDGLLSLGRKVDKERLDKACNIAMEYNQYSYGFIKNMLENNMTEVSTEVSGKELPKHGNLRGRTYYNEHQ